MENVIEDFEITEDMIIRNRYLEGYEKSFIINNLLPLTYEKVLSIKVEGTEFYSMSLYDIIFKALKCDVVKMDDFYKLIPPVEKKFHPEISVFKTDDNKIIVREHIYDKEKETLLNKTSHYINTETNEYSKRSTDFNYKYDDAGRLTYSSYTSTEFKDGNEQPVSSSTPLIFIYDNNDIRIPTSHINCCIMHYVNFDEKFRITSCSYDDIVEEFEYIDSEKEFKIISHGKFNIEINSDLSWITTFTIPK